MKKVYLTGYINKNLGDDLFFITVLERYPDITFVFEDIPSGFYSKLFKDYKNVEAIPFLKNSIFHRIKTKIVRTLYKNRLDQYYSLYQKKYKIKVDAYLKIGGSIFIEPKVNIDSVKKRYIAEYKYFNHIPFFYIGCNFGPYSQQDFYKNVEFVVKQCKSICFRDTYSYKLFKHISNVSVAPDVLFGIKQICSNTIKKANSLGISLICLSRRPSLARYYKSYLGSISSFLISHSTNYESIRLFSFCEPQGDEQSIKDLLSLLPDTIKEKIEVVAYNGNYKDFLFKFSELEYLITTRFHAVILGLVYEAKIVPIIYDEKITHVLNDLKCDLPRIYLDKLNEDTISEAFSTTSIINVDTQIFNSQKQFFDFDFFVKN